MKNEKTNKKTGAIIVLVGNVICGLLLGGLILYTSYLFKSTKTVDVVLTKLEKISEAKSKQISTNVLNDMDHAKKMAELEEAKKLLKEPLVKDADVVKIDTDKIAMILSEEIKNYIRANPKKTLVDLQNDNAFKKIAIQTVGQNGYSVLEGHDGNVIYFHKNKNFIGQNYENVNSDLPELRVLLINRRYKQDTYGYYDWREENKEIRRKYARIIFLGEETADNVELVLIVTGYVDDYRIVKESFEKNTLNLFKQEARQNNFDDVALINNDDRVIFASNYTQDLGVDLKWENYSDEKIKEDYFNNKDKKNIFVTEPHFDISETIYPRIAIFAPVWDNENMLGFLSLEKKMSSIFDITQNKSYLGEISYLVENKYRYLISPIENNEASVLVQQVNTENVNNCFENKENIRWFSTSFDGKRVLTTHKLVPGTNWCLITEVASDKVDFSLWLEIIISILVFGLFLIRGIFRMKQEIKKEQYGEKSIKTGFDEFLTKVKLWHIVIGSFMIGSIFVFNWSVEKWSTNLLNKLFILLTFSLTVAMFFYGSKLKNSTTRGLFSLGALFVISRKLIQIIWERFSLARGFEETYFLIPGIVLSFIGVFLIFYGFKGELEE